MIMSEETYLGSLAYPMLIAPVITRVGDEKHIEPATTAELLAALRDSEQHMPGFLLELTRSLMDKTGVTTNLQETFLRLHASREADEAALSAHNTLPPRAEYAALAERAHALRTVLSSMPDEMADRRRFLETSKVIASSIKKLLDATNAVYAIVPESAKPAVERRKKEFVHYSKRFSNTLKEYFKGDDANLVFIAANQLIFQTQLIVRVVREKTRHQPRS